MNPNVGIDANVGISNTDINAAANISPGVNVGSGDQSVQSGASATQQSTDVNTSSSMSQSTTTNQSSSTGGGTAPSSGATTSAPSNASQGASASGSGSGTAGTAAIAPSSGGTSTGAAAGATQSEDKERHGKARGHNSDRAKGLDRADEAAGKHGAEGRANAREKQGRD